jgi:hypothetical protein
MRIGPATLAVRRLTIDGHAFRLNLDQPNIKNFNQEARASFRPIMRTLRTNPKRERIWAR